MSEGESAAQGVGAVVATANQVGDAVGGMVAAMPEWATIAIAAGAAAFFGTLVGSRLGRGGGGARGREPSLGPAATAATAEPGDADDPHPENPAFKALNRILENKGVDGKEQDTRMREFAGAFQEMREKLHALETGDEDLREVAERALRALEAGEFRKADDFLAAIAAEDGGAGRKLRDRATRHLVSAATVKVVAGDLALAQAELERALGLYREAVELLPPTAEAALAEFLNKYGTAAYQAGDHDTAIAAFERALRHLERTLGEEHTDVATALNNLALLYYARGAYDRAEPLYRRALKIDEKQLGNDHVGVATDLNNLALLYKKQGNLKAAEPLLKRALEIKEKTFTPGHPSLVTGLRNYASVLKAMGRADEARQYEQRAASLPPKRRSTEEAAE